MEGDLVAHHQQTPCDKMPHAARKHGGVVAEAKDMDYELVAKASAKLTLMTGTEKQEVELKPAGDKFEAIGSFKVGPGTKAVAVVTIAGKPTGTVRFVLN